MDREFQQHKHITCLHTVYSEVKLKHTNDGQKPFYNHYTGQAVLSGISS